MGVIDTSPLIDRLAFARQIKASSDAELLELMQGERRAGILRDIIDDMPAVFRADRAGTLDAVVHWRVAGRSDGEMDTFELVIANGTFTVSDQPVCTPRLTLTLGAVDFLKMVTGNANPKMLFLRGRMKARGDLGLTTRFPSLFEVPTP
jgi:putative sterol carrier protein